MPVELPPPTPPSHVTKIVSAETFTLNQNLPGAINFVLQRERQVKVQAGGGRHVERTPPPHLVDHLPGLQHVQPLGQGAVLDGAGVAHVVHHHRAQGVFLQQDLSGGQPVLQALVLVDVDVVGEGPTIWRVGGGGRRVGGGGSSGGTM